MKNVRKNMLKTCIILTSDEYTEIIKNIFGNVSIDYSLDGISIYTDDNVIDTTELHTKLAEYFNVDRVTSTHSDDCSNTIGVWIVYQNNTEDNNQNEKEYFVVDELKGRIVDISEDYMTDNNMIRKNEEVAIYGNNYNMIADIVENNMNTLIKNNKKQFTDEQMMNIKGNIIGAFLAITLSNDIKIPTEDIEILVQKIVQTFINWNLYTEKTYKVTFKITGTYTTTIKATSLDEAEKKANEYNYAKEIRNDGMLEKQICDENGNELFTSWRML